MLIPILFLVANEPPTYGLVQFLRIACFLGFGWLAKSELENKHAFTGIASIALAIVYNPIIKITMALDDWQIMDGITCAFLTIWLLIVGIISLVKYRRRRKQDAEVG